MKEQNDEEKKSLGLTHKKEEFEEWYPEVLTKSGFVDYSFVSGMLVFRPAAYAAWQIIVNAVDSEFKKNGIEDVYFPLFIPERFLEKEKEHFVGFEPEVAWVTHAGKSKLEERLAVRPTSETIMYPSYSKWIRSWRDLPLRYNQWNNAVRWEFKHPTPLLRTREFLWCEGHSVFANKEEADKERNFIMGLWERVLKDYLALPGIAGRKTENEKFAGAVASYSIEHIMPDGYVVQGPDFHNDGENFAKAFDIKFLDKDGKEKYAWQNTYAISTRELGVMVATHSDDKGLILPPRIAYIQVVIVPIIAKGKEEKILGYARKVADILKERYRIKLDDREGYTPGYKYNEWELKGVPLRIEIGLKEVEKGQVMFVRRDTGAKAEASLGDLVEKVEVILDDIHKNLYERAKKFMQEHIHNVETYDEFKHVLKTKKGIIHAPWCGSPECEEKIKEETGAKTSNIPFDQSDLHGKCIYCGKEAKYMVNFAKSY
ncbi:MAG: proline--tRNA ligase [Candidatus Micrarchaeota archaeon]